MRAVSATSEQTFWGEHVFKVTKDLRIKDPICVWLLVSSGAPLKISVMSGEAVLSIFVAPVVA